MPFCWFELEIFTFNRQVFKVIHTIVYSKFKSCYNFFQRAFDWNGRTKIVVSSARCKIVALTIKYVLCQCIEQNCLAVISSRLLVYWLNCHISVSSVITMGSNMVIFLCYITISEHFAVQRVSGLDDVIAIVKSRNQ